MKRNKLFIAIVAFAVAIPMLIAVACSDTNKVWDNEKDVFTLAVTNGEITGVFNPFNYSSNNDAEILGRMLMPLVTHDKEGEIVWGRDENCIALDVKTETIDGGASSKLTFVLKPGLQFADGSALTLKDVMFSYHIYLDVFYTGSATLYSSAIKGLSEYRGALDSNDNVVGGNVDYIAGINRITEDTTIGNVTYDVAEYNEDGDFTGKGYEAFSIELDGVDPKALFDAECFIASMVQYSGDLASQFSWETKNYAVRKGNKSFINGVIGGGDTTATVRVPLSSGPYQAADSSYNPTLEYGKFYESGVAKLVRNEYFGEDNDEDSITVAKIKKMAYRNTDVSNIYEQVKKGTIQYGVSDSPTSELVGKLRADDATMGQDSFYRWAYGYFGINAAKIPELEARQAIMLAMDASLTTSYFPTDYAVQVNVGMPLESWAYPTGAKDKYPYISNDSNGNVVAAELDQVAQLLISAGYKVTWNGVTENADGKVLNQTITIPISSSGGEDTHPAYTMVYNGVENILNKLGQDVKIVGDLQGLDKMGQGGVLEMWVGAWTTSTDPDMTQVYHKDSSASAMKNWGFDKIKENVDGIYDGQLDMLNELATYIEDSRKSYDKEERKPYIADALDLVMDLAVEMPTYNNKTVRFYDKNVIDEDTLVPRNKRSGQIEAIARIWEVSFKK